MMHKEKKSWLPTILRRMLSPTFFSLLGVAFFSILPSGCQSSADGKAIALEVQALRAEVERLNKEQEKAQRQIIEAHAELLAAPKALEEKYLQRTEQRFMKMIGEAQLRIAKQQSETNLHLDRLTRTLKEKGALPKDWESGLQPQKTIITPTVNRNMNDNDDDNDDDDDDDLELVIPKKP
jgi:outer membrane murein-binding lipoprotein Lpp